MLLKKFLLKRRFLYGFFFNKEEHLRYKDSYINFGYFDFKDDDNIDRYEWRMAFYFSLMNFIYISYYDYITIF